jgi:toxin ParE1/3/4
MYLSTIKRVKKTTYGTELLSPENAAGQLDRIEKRILSLGEYPEKFRQYEREPWKSRNTRVVPVDNYVIFYIPDKTKKLVTVIRVCIPEEI